MTDRRSIAVLAGAVVAGVAAVLLAMQWTDRKINSSVTQVVVAVKDIDPGERLSPENMRVMDWPRASMVRGASPSLASLDGRVAMQPVAAGEPILEQRLAVSGSRAGLSALIAPGRRAMTVKVNEVIGVGGFAMPGNYVDILVTFNHNENPPISRIVLERILVLAVAQDHTVKDESKPKVVNAVTLEVTPEQAERLDLARSIGSLSLMLRNQADSEPVASRGALLTDILRVSPASSTKRGAYPSTDSAPSRIEIIRGVQRTAATSS